MKEPPICYYCGCTGHFIRDCNGRKQDQRQGSNPRRNNNNNRNRNNNQNRDRNGRTSNRYPNNRDRSCSCNNYSLGANLGIIIIEAKMMITIALIKTPLIDLLLLIIKVLIILYKIRLRHPLLLLTSGKYCSIINLFEELWLPIYTRKLKMLILFKLLPILHLLNVMSLFRTNPIRLLLIVVLQSA